MNSASVLTDMPQSPAPSTVQEMNSELHRLQNEVRNLVSENNTLKTRLSKALEHKDAGLLLDEAEEFHNLFMYYESKLLELCANSRMQMGMLHQLNDSPNSVCAKVREMVNQVSRELCCLHQQIEITRNAFGAQFNPSEEGTLS